MFDLEAVRGVMVVVAVVRRPEGKMRRTHRWVSTIRANESLVS